MLEKFLKTKEPFTATKAGVSGSTCMKYVRGGILEIVGKEPEMIYPTNHEPFEREVNVYRAI